MRGRLPVPMNHQSRGLFRCQKRAHSCDHDGRGMHPTAMSEGCGLAFAAGDNSECGVRQGRCN